MTYAIEVVNNLFKARVTKTIWLLLFLLILRRRARDTFSFTRQGGGIVPPLALILFT